MKDHIILWLEQWHTGTGEQGAESIYAHFIKLENQYQAIANPVDRLKYIFSQQMLESEPSLVALRSPPQSKLARNSHLPKPYYRYFIFILYYLFIPYLIMGPFYMLS